VREGEVGVDSQGLRKRGEVFGKTHEAVQQNDERSALRPTGSGDDIRRRHDAIVP
jgi:hypothetical protein